MVVLLILVVSWATVQADWGNRSDPPIRDAPVSGLLLMLLTTYHRGLESAARQALTLAPEAPWDFWERGVIATAALIALGVFGPPLSLTDRTYDMQNGVFQRWGEITRSVGGGGQGTGPGAGGAIGFTSHLALGGAARPTNRGDPTHTPQGGGGGAPGPPGPPGPDPEPPRAD